MRLPLINTLAQCLLIWVSSSCTFLLFGQQASYSVEFSGALRDIMHKGDISAKASLMDFSDDKHLYALGAVEDLKGEILVLDSKPYVASKVDGGIQIDKTFNHKATLLVYARVDEWESVTHLPEEQEQPAMEDFIEKAAAEHGINIDRPFPFIIEGKVRTADWHVIDWPEGDTDHTHEKHIKSGLNGTMTDHDVIILGFYSNDHHGIFTHHSSNVHMHCITRDGDLVAHIDNIVPGEKMKLNLPRVIE